MVRTAMRPSTRASHQPTLLGVWARRCRQPTEPISLPVRELRPEANADVNASENIRRQGLAILARAGEPPGVPPQALEANKR